MPVSRTRRRIATGLAATALLLLGSAAPGAANPADERFEQLDGPIAPFVVRPDEFGMDPSLTLIDPAALLDRIDTDRAMDVVEIAVVRPLRHRPGIGAAGRP